MLDTKEVLLVNKLVSMRVNTTEYRIIRNTLTDEGKILLKKIKYKQVRDRYRQKAKDNIDSEVFDDEEEEEEIWIDIEGFDNYSVSLKGRVMNNTTKRILKPVIDSYGYKYVNLSNGRRYHHKRIHKLVTDAFLKKEDGKSEVDHIDRNKVNNRLSNLRYVSRSDNLKNASKREDTSSKYKGVCFYKKIQ